jgi:hypothetical protein
MAEVQQFVLPWIGQIESEGSDLVQGVPDHLEELLHRRVVRLTAQSLGPETQELLDDLTLSFTSYDVKRGLILFGTYLNNEVLDVLEVEHEGGVYAFVVVRIADSAALVVLPEVESASWWPSDVREGGNPLSQEICNKIFDLARP